LDYGGDPVTECAQLLKRGGGGVFGDFAKAARPSADRRVGSDIPGALSGRSTFGAAGEGGEGSAHAAGDATAYSPARSWSSRRSARWSRSGPWTSTSRRSAASLARRGEGSRPCGVGATATEARPRGQRRPTPEGLWALVNAFR